MVHKKYLGYALFVIVSGIDATPLVYNMRIRRVFTQESDENMKGAGQARKKKSNWLLSAVPVVYQRDRHVFQPELGIDVHENMIMGGSIFNVRYRSPTNWWWEATTGVEKEHLIQRGTTNFDVSRRGFDDFVFSGGVNMFPQQEMQCALYGLLGIPSKRAVKPYEFTGALVGTRFLALGGGAECSYTLCNELERSSFVLAQVRFIHFFDRSWFPILPCGSLIKPGNTTDVLLTFHHREKRNSFEVGYNPTIFTNQGVVDREGNVMRTSNFVRESFYLSLTHICKNEENPLEPLILGTGFTYAWSERFDTRITSWWINISKVF